MPPEIEVIEAHDRVRVLPAYDMDSHARTRHDLWSGQTGEVKEVRGSDALVRLPGSDVWLTVERLAPLTRSFRCACCDADYDSAKPQDPERDRGYGYCRDCRPLIIRSMVRYGFACREWTEAQAQERIDRYG
ncbi:MAG: hypothetical protein E6Q97_16985 [Desulfurellales bacterium]|nr:MAG: hypothetical protein E6Q97_16985 [Desulfurellales bacterium]